jgi:hypothetical protein
MAGYDCIEKIEYSRLIDGCKGGREASRGVHPGLGDAVLVLFVLGMLKIAIIGNESHLGG